MLSQEMILIPILTILVVVLTYIAFSSNYKLTEHLMSSGKYDVEIFRDFTGANSRVKKKISKLFYNFTSTILTILLIIITSFTLVYKVKEGQVFIDNKTILVVGSDSMSKFYSNDYRNKIELEKVSAKEDQFTKGDLLILERVNEEDNLVLFDIYGYIDKNGNIILHRYIGDTDNNKLVFRGDANSSKDKSINRNQIILHYTNNKVEYVGNFILYLKSLLGLYCLACVIIVFVLAEVYTTKFEKIKKARRNIVVNKYSAVVNTILFERGKLTSESRGTKNE